MCRAFVIVTFTLTLLACTTVGSDSTPSAPTTLTQAPDRGNPTVRVWVDTAYGFYHCPNTAHYGKTQQGVYMTQKEAQDRSYKPAATVCR